METSHYFNQPPSHGDFSHDPAAADPENRDSGMNKTYSDQVKLIVLLSQQIDCNEDIVLNFLRTSDVDQASICCALFVAYRQNALNQKNVTNNSFSRIAEQ